MAREARAANSNEVVRDVNLEDIFLPLNRMQDGNDFFLFTKKKKIRNEND